MRRSDPFRPYVSYDVILYGALRKKGFLQESRAYLIPGSFAVAGLNFTPMYNFSRFFRAGLSLDAQYDRQGRRHEFVLPGLRPQSRCGAQRLPARRISALQVPQSEQPDAGRRLPVQRALTVRCTIEIK